MIPESFSSLSTKTYDKLRSIVTGTGLTKSSREASAKIDQRIQEAVKRLEVQAKEIESLGKITTSSDRTIRELNRQIESEGAKLEKKPKDAKVLAKIAGLQAKLLKVQGMRDAAATELFERKRNWTQIQGNLESIRGNLQIAQRDHRQALNYQFKSISLLRQVSEKIDKTLVKNDLEHIKSLKGSLQALKGITIFGFEIGKRPMLGPMQRQELLHALLFSRMYKENEKTDPAVVKAATALEKEINKTFSKEIAQYKKEIFEDPEKLLKETKMMIKAIKEERYLPSDEEVAQIVYDLDILTNPDEWPQALIDQIGMRKWDNIAVGAREALESLRKIS